MKEQDISSLRFLKENIEEIVAPLDAAQIEYFGEGSERIQNSLNLVMEELSLVVLLLMGVGASITNEELDLLNDMRHIVLGYDIPELNSDNYMELQRQFHAAYPERIFTVDHMPTTVRILLAYDEKHGSNYGIKARELFAKFADAIIVTDENKDFIEWALVENFKEFMMNG